MKKMLLPILTVAMMLVMSALIFGQAAEEVKSKETIKFAKGSNSKVVQGTIGEALEKEYVVYARKGQTLTVELWTDADAFFYIIPAVERDSDDGYGNSEGREVLKIRDTGKYTVGINMIAVVSTGSKSENAEDESPQYLKQKFKLKIQLK